MKTGIQNSTYYKNNTKVADYEKIKEHGYDCVDYQNLGDTKGKLFEVSEQEFLYMLSEERKQVEGAGIEISQCHAPWPTDDTTEEKRKITFENMKKAVRGVQALNGKYLVVHPVMPYGWGEEKDADKAEEMNEAFFTSLCEYASAYGVGICMENMPMKAHRISPMPQTAAFVKRLNLPNLFLCLDTGHCNVYGIDCGEMVRLCGDRLKTLHVHDNNSLSDSHIFPYTGTINWDSFKTALREAGFNGCLSIEAHINKNYPKDLWEYMAIGLSKTARSLANG